MAGSRRFGRAVGDRIVSRRSPQGRRPLNGAVTFAPTDTSGSSRAPHGSGPLIHGNLVAEAAFGFVPPIIDEGAARTL